MSDDNLLRFVCGSTSGNCTFMTVACLSSGLSGIRKTATTLYSLRS
jgi:hypothetical protein